MQDITDALGHRDALRAAAYADFDPARQNIRITRPQPAAAEAFLRHTAAAFAHRPVADAALAALAACYSPHESALAALAACYPPRESALAACYSPGKHESADDQAVFERARAAILDATEPLLDSLTDALAMAAAADNTTPADFANELDDLRWREEGERATIATATAALAAIHRRRDAVLKRKLEATARADILAAVYANKRPRADP
jgi:hypothetical protein